MLTSTHLLRTRRFLPLFVTQLFNAFNDNLYKTTMVLFVVYAVYNDETTEAGFSGLASALSSEWFQSEIAKSRRAHLNRYEAGTDQILGVTQYADPDPRAVETDGIWPDDDLPACALAPIRFAAQFEEAAQ